MKALQVLAAVALLATFPLTAQEIQINKENKTIAISTSDQASTIADVAAISIGFQSYGKDHDALYDEASRTSNAISAALVGAGVPKGAIESTEQSLRPLSLNNDDDKARYGQGMRFAFSQSWRVTVPAAQAAAVLQVAIAAGANNSGNIQWELRGEQALEAEAARKALEHARQIATSMAQGLGVKLGALVYAANQAPPRGLAPEAFNGLGMGYGAGTGGGVYRLNQPLAITPEQITKSATVYAVFAIE